MELKLTQRMLKTAGRVVIACIALGVSLFAQGTWLDRGTCTNRTFKGAYGFTATGYVLPGYSAGSFASFSPTGTLIFEAAVPIQGVQLITADGKGNLTDKESLSLGGAPLGTTTPTTSPVNPNWVFSNHYGTYKVNSDCTGTAFLTNQNTTTTGIVNFISVAFVINKEGTKIRMVGVPTCPPVMSVTSCTYDSGGIQRVVTSIGERLDAPE
jgi:hypothetical protein